MVNKKTIAISAVMASTILSGASHTVSHAEDKSQINQTIKEVGVNPEHPEIRPEIDRYGVKQLELEAVKQESKKKETELNNHNQEKTLAEEKLKTLTDEEDKLKKETEALENKLKEIEEAKAKEEAAKNAVSTSRTSNGTTSNGGSYGYGSGSLSFGSDGLLVEQHTAASQNVINLLLGIPNHSNGSWYHQSTGLDSYIDQLSIEEAVNVIHRIEGAGFGQTGAGYAGFDTPESHRVFVEQQVNGRFGGDIRLLLKKWGTYSYGGY